MLILDPYQQTEFEQGEEVYLLRGLTSREKIRLLPEMMTGQELTPAIMLEVLEHGLVGWKNEKVKFDSSNMDKMIDMVDFDDLIPIVTKIISLSMLSEEQEKNLI